MGTATGSKRLELTLLEELASGTFARVYLAEAKGAGGVDRLVAVKVLREKWADSEEVLARTRDEARLLARLRHKHIVRVEELSELDDQPAIIMEYVEGMTLQQLLDHLSASNRPFPARAALQIGVATASALDAAYRRVPYGEQEPLRVVHRDVKPSNVMLSIDGELKVLDFGTARASSPLRSAQTGMVRFGSWKYMSPERKEGDRGDHPADIYSLGLLLIELLGSEWIKGLPVSPGEHDHQLRLLVEGLQDVGMPNDAWTRALKDLLLQMAAFSPDVRPSAQQLAEVLRQYAEQARGQTMDALAADVVQGELRGRRENLAEGALTGTRLFVSLDGSTPPHARRADGSAYTDPGLIGAEPAPQPAQAQPTHYDDDFDEPATVVAPYPSAGRYAVANPGAAQVRFATGEDPNEPERTEPTPADSLGYGSPASAPWEPEPATVQQAPVPQPHVTFDPQPATTPSPQQGGSLPPWEQSPQAFQPMAEPAPQPAPAHGRSAPPPYEPHPGFAPAGSDPAETEYLPPPDAAPAQPSYHAPVVAQPAYHAPVAAQPAYHAPVSTQPSYQAPIASGPIASGPVASGPIAPTPLPDPVPPPRKSKLPLVLGVLFVAAVICAGLPTVGWVVYTYLGIGVPEYDVPDAYEPELPVVPADPPPPDDADAGGDAQPAEPVVPPEVPEPAAGSGVEVSINAADRAIRRIELANTDGELLQGSKGSLEGRFEPGRYQITIKVAGRDPVVGDLVLGDVAVDLLCAPDDKMVKVLCKGPDGGISLVLK